MKKSVGPYIGIGVIVVCLGGVLPLFKKNAINYVPFNEAAHATRTSVQIMGAPVPGTMFYDQAAHTLHFKLNDGSGQTMPVLYKGPKPEDLNTAMDKATKIGAQGVYDPTAQAFMADNLLVKCPSKYQGTGEQERSYSSKA